MKLLIPPALLALLFGSCLLCGCSRNNQAPPDAAASLATSIPARDGESPDAASAAADHPCQLLTDAQVREVFPGAASGKRDPGLDKYGIATCMWDTPTDRFVVQMFQAKSGSVEDELRSRMSGSIDPMQANAGDRVRYETMAGIGDEAMLVVEKSDPQRGILADTAILVMQRRARRAALFTGYSLAAGDRPTALKSLEALGRSAAKRL